MTLTSDYVSCDKRCCHRTVRVWDIREPVMSLSCGIMTSSSDKADIDAEAEADSKRVVSQKMRTGLPRKVVWPVSSVSYFCCASDECYL